MRLRVALIAAGSLTLAACAPSNDVRTTGSSNSQNLEQLPPVDEFESDVDPTPETSSPSPATTPTTTAPTTTTTTTTTVAVDPGTRPDQPHDLSLMVLLESDLPGWKVISPMDVPSEPTWEALDCADMNTAWAATGRPGVRSRGSIDGVAFRNTAVEYDTAAEAAEVLDAVDRVWNDCVLFDTSTGQFWSEPIEVAGSIHRSSGIVIGDESIDNWALAYWQIDNAVVILEVEGEDMWTRLDPLLTTMSARLDGTPTPLPPTDSTPIGTDSTEPSVTEPSGGTGPVIDTVTEPEPTVPSPNEPGHFPPADEEWTDHPLAYLALTPGEVGDGWRYKSGSRNDAAPADPDDAFEGCDTPIPPTLDGYELGYELEGSLTEAEFGTLVGVGTADDAQMMIDAFEALAGCDFGEEDFVGDFDIVQVTVEGADSSVVIAATIGTDFDVDVHQIIGIARIDGVVIAAYAFSESGDESDDDALDANVELINRAIAAMFAKL